MRISGYATVIVPLHQGALTIARCLEAIAAQTYRPLEIVVVDDGSSDAGPAWLRAFKRNHPEVPLHVVTQPRAGTGAALNAGLAKARGEWVAFAHQGDEWQPTKLAAQIAQLQGAPGAAFSLCGVTERLGERETRMPPPAIVGGLLYEPVCLSSLVARRAALEELGGFDVTPGIAVTHDMVLRLVQRSPGKRLPESLAVCRRAVGTALPVSAFEASLGKLAAEGKLSPWQLSRSCSRLRTRAGWRALIAEDPAAAAEEFKQALAANPWRADSWLGLACAKLDDALVRSGLLQPERAALAGGRVPGQHGAEDRGR